jgi:hypothetical protein
MKRSKQMAKSTTQEVLSLLKEAEKSPTSLSGAATLRRGHRGVDVTYTTGTSSGTHMHMGSVSTDLVSMSRLEATKANAFEAGYKEAMTKVWNMLPNPGETGVVVNMGRAIALKPMANGMIPDNTSVILVSKEDVLPDAEVSGLPVIVAEAIKELEVGWYQDEKADLYYYEGESHWKEVDLATNKKLTDDAILGKLEYIG